MDPRTEFWVTLCTGFIGGHKFAQKKIGMGIVYVCTIGLFMFGWWYDTYKAYQNYSAKREMYAPPLRQLREVPAPGLTLRPGEHCVYSSTCYRWKKGTRLAGFKTDGMRISGWKGQHYMRANVSESMQHAIYEDTVERSYGTLFVTDQRVVFRSEEGGFDYSLSAVSNWNQQESRVDLYATAGIFTIELPNAIHFTRVLSAIKRKVPII